MHCPECGFVNGEGANYCQKCGAFLAGVGEPSDATTAQYQLDDESGELRPVDAEHPAGGGRAGETFELSGERIAIGRSPDADVFLDDVTVSRNHALLVRRRDGLYLDDLGSLNGSYVNRHRIESHKLQAGDELQIGKYKLTYLER
jgi:pSer/pThr/pTyr-binding forkhead associated (FHA) protein